MNEAEEADKPLTQPIENPTNTVEELSFEDWRNVGYNNDKSAFFEDNIKDHILILSDKKLKNRLEIMNTIRACLLQCQQIPLFEQFKETLATDLCGFVKKEKPLDVAIAACKLMAIIQLSVDFSSNPIVFAISRPTLLRCIQNSKSAKLQVEALYSLGLMHYFCECDDEDEEELISLLTNLIQTHKDPSLTSAAILLWIILQSIRPTRSLLSPSLPSMASSLIACLSVNDMSLRIAASKGLAFINEILLKHPQYERIPPLNQIETELQEAVSEYNRYWKESKDPEKKAELRQIRNACLEGGHPDVELTFKCLGYTTVEFHLWQDLVLYELCKRVMGEGFAVHLIYNELFASVFKNCITSQTLMNDETKKSQKINSEMKRNAVRDARKKHEKMLQAYDNMCLDDYCCLLDC